MIPAARMLFLGAILGACSGDGEILDTIEFLVQDGSIRLEEDGSASVILVAEVTGSEERPTYEIVDSPVLGQLVGDGAIWEYVGNDNANGQDEFTWRARVGDVASELATITVFIDSVNDAPQGQALMVVTNEDEPQSGTLPASDFEGDPLVYSLVQAPEFGRVDLGTDGTFTYTPERNYVGSDSFLWAATDDSNASTGPVRVDITINEENDPPEVADNGFVGPEDQELFGELFATDPDGDPVTWAEVTPPTNGILDLNVNLGTFSYTPNLNYFGPDSFQVRANDGLADSEVSTIDITITSVNDQPVVIPAALTTDEDTALTSTVAWSDVEEEVRPTPDISFRIGQPPLRGIVSINASTGEFTYTPNANVNGSDSFTVIASDPAIDSLPGLITIGITPVNDVPRLNNVGLLTTQEDLSVTGAVTGVDPEGDQLTFRVSSPAANGTVEISPVTGQVAYTPNPDYNGTDQFAVVANDGTEDSDAAIVDVLVRPVNDAPVPNPSSLTTITGVPAEATLTATDPEGDQLFYLIVQQPANGNAVVDTASGVVTHTPDPGYNGTDVLVWQVTDGEASINSVLPITVSPDSDGDTIGDSTDNCVDVPNEDQSDVSNNGVGDVCDCYDEAFAAELDDEFFADDFKVTLQTGELTSETHALRLNGDGSFVETVGFPGCGSFLIQAQVAAGPPAPEVGDFIRFLARPEGDPNWTLIVEQEGTGLEESFDLLAAQTAGLVDLSAGNAEFRIEVVADQEDDLFFVDDLSISCDEDADFLVDCVESGLEGYDLTEADADMDGLLDAGELEKGTDPNLPDTDFDNVSDLDDNCPLTSNPDQADDDNDGIGNACSVFGFYDDYDASMMLDPMNWVSGQQPGVYTITNGPTPGPIGVNSVEVGEVSGVQLISEPYDFSNCTDVAVNFYIHNRDAETNDGVTMQYSLDGGTSWTTFPTANSFRPGANIPNGRITGAQIGVNFSSPWTPVIFTYNDPVSVGPQFSVRWDNTSSLPFVDRFYVDSVAIDCDNDADGLANVLEKDVVFSNLANPDSDGDGTLDGEEFLNGDLTILP